MYANYVCVHLSPERNEYWWAKTPNDVPPVETRKHTQPRPIHFGSRTADGGEPKT